MDTSLRITEIFYSLQGESSFTGLPTVFVRLTGCPLRCVYCDTAYAFEGGERRSFDAILDEVDQYSTPYVTVTGGEPLAQPEALNLMTALLDHGKTVSLETSGAMSVEAVDPRVIKILDLKTPSSGEMHRNLESNIEFLDAKDEIKFVVGDRADFDWAVSKMIQFNLEKRVSNCLFSPIHGQLQPAQLAEWILQDKVAARLQIQLHKLLWGDRKGV